MSDIYQDLLEGKAALDENVEAVDVCGMDAFLTGGEKIKVASIDDLFSFLRIGNNTLVHKADKDLWRVGEDSNGDVIIERLFDPSTKEPLRI